MAKKLIIMALIFTTPLVIFWLAKLFLPVSVKSATNPVKLNINNQLFKVEIADTDQKRTLGLSGRTSLAKDQGMLFIFPKEGIYPFWMKDMLIPLDFIWINNNTIVDLSKNIQPPVNSSASPVSLIPTKTVNMVLELNAGSIDFYQLKINDRVSFER